MKVLTLHKVCSGAVPTGRDLVIAGWRAGVRVPTWSSLTFTVGGVCYPGRDESPSSLLHLLDQQKGCIITA